MDLSYIIEKLPSTKVSTKRAVTSVKGCISNSSKFRKFRNILIKDKDSKLNTKDDKYILSVYDRMDPITDSKIHQSEVTQTIDLKKNEIVFSDGTRTIAPGALLSSLSMNTGGRGDAPSECGGSHYTSVSASQSIASMSLMSKIR